MKDHRSQQKAYAFGAPVNGSCETSRLAREMESQIQVQKVLEDVAGYTSNGLLSH